MRGTDLISDYIEYTSGGEVPVVFNRWAMIGGLAGMLERNLYLPFGYGNIHPNMYLMLLGSAGTKKSTTIKLVKKLMKNAGYNTFSSERTSKEKFLIDLANQAKVGSTLDSVLEANLFGDDEVDPSVDVPCFIPADEANDFFGINNIEFLSILGSLWDWEGNYETSTKTDGKVIIPNPTLTILSGNTPTNFATAFPPTIFGQGFFSRILLIHGEPNGNKVPRPKQPDPKHTDHIVESLARVRRECQGEVKFTKTADALVDAIYLNYKAPDDPRFESFANRRQTHFLKLCMVIAASQYSTLVTDEIVIEANSILTFAETLMPKALGSFGAAKDADVVHKIVTLIKSSDKPVTAPELWAHIHRDLSRTSEFQDIIQRLLNAKQIQMIPEVGFLPIRKTLNEMVGENKFVDFDKYLTTEELRIQT